MVVQSAISPDVFVIPFEAINGELGPNRGFGITGQPILGKAVTVFDFRCPDPGSNMALCQSLVVPPATSYHFPVCTRALTTPPR